MTPQEKPLLENSLKLMIWLNCAVAEAELKIAGRQDRHYLNSFLKSQNIDPNDRPGVFGLVQRLRVVAFEAGRLTSDRSRNFYANCSSPALPAGNGSRLKAWLNWAVADAELQITNRSDQVYLKNFLKHRHIDPNAKPSVFGLVERLRAVAYEAGRLQGERAQQPCCEYPAESPAVPGRTILHRILRRSLIVKSRLFGASFLMGLAVGIIKRMVAGIVRTAAQRKGQ